MTGKERAELRGKANTLDPILQLGKGGMSDAFIEQVDGALNTRELIKLKVLLESSPITPREAADEVAQRTNAEVIQVIGGVIVLYRINPELHKKAKKKAVAKKKRVSRFSKFEDKPQVKTKKESKMAAQRKAAAARKFGK